MRFWTQCHRIIFGGLFALCLTQSSRAVVFFSTGDVDYNTVAPTGVLAHSGWQYVGLWNGFQGTAIGPTHFIAARHVGGTVGDVFILDGVNYPTTAFVDDTDSDLRIWEVAGTFPTWARLYRAQNEVGRPLVVFGRGLTRGEELSVGGVLKGWYWGDSGGQIRWGQNSVAAAVQGGSYWGALLYATFDASGGDNEAHLAVGDSSGPVFIHDGVDWALAGVAAAVDGYFNTTSSGSGFIAAIFDARGLYYSSDPATVPWQFVSGPTPVPSGFYITRTSARVAWIDSVVPPVTNVPLFHPGAFAVLAIALLGAGSVAIKRGQRSQRIPG